MTEADTSERPKSLWYGLFARLICLVALAVMCSPILAVGFGYKDILLYFLPARYQVVAEVQSTNEGDPFFIFPKRGGDWKISYLYEVNDQAYQAKDVIPPAQRQQLEEQVVIRYFPLSPKISKINTQVSGTPLVALVYVVSVMYYLIKDR